MSKDKREKGALEVAFKLYESLLPKELDSYQQSPEQLQQYKIDLFLAAIEIVTNGKANTLPKLPLE